MKLIALVEVRDLETNHSGMFLRFRAPDGRNIDMPASLDQVQALLTQMPAEGEQIVGERVADDYREVSVLPSHMPAVPGSTDDHLRIAAFAPKPVDDADEWGLG